MLNSMLVPLACFPCPARCLHYELLVHEDTVAIRMLWVPVLGHETPGAVSKADNDLSEAENKGMCFG